jgi:hypothetical protein
MSPAPDAPESNEEWIARQLAEAPALSSAQRDLISSALRRTVTDPGAPARAVVPDQKRGRPAA